MALDPSDYDFEPENADAPAPDSAPDDIPEYKPPATNPKPAPLRLVQPAEIIPNPPPHSVGSEKSILSLYWAWPETRAAIQAAGVSEDHFYSPGNRVIWNALAAHPDADLPLLAQRLLDQGMLDRAGGPASLADIYSYALLPQCLDQHLQILAEKSAARSAMTASRKLIDDLEASPGESAEILLRAVTSLKGIADAAGSTSPLLARAYALQYSPFARPPADEVLMQIGQAPIAARGNLSVLQGKAKVGKSAVVASILGAALRGRYQAKGDTLGVDWTAERHTGAVIHLDTEQSPADWWALVTRAFARSGNKQFLDRLVSIPLVQFGRRERLAILESVIADQIRQRGTVDLVIVDGVADLCISPNDEEESLELVAKLMAICHKYNVAIVCILHENPGTDQGKTRGHLGSELNRKAFANLRIDKDKDGVSTLYGTDMRKRDIPQNQGICFQWNDEEHMHTVIGNAREVEAERNSEKSQRSKSRKLDQDRAGLEDIFGDEESMSYSELWPAVVDRFVVKERMAKNKVSEWIKAGIVTKNASGEYEINS